uniref:Putative helicase n=1 Tax=viral metagenome TaxID=1070528 RepID=A0A6M3JNW4_9ZZZZ
MTTPTLYKKDGLYVFRGPPEYSELPRTMGFVYGKTKRAEWTTPDPMVACLLIKYAASHLNNELAPFLAKRKTRMAMSQAVNPMNPRFRPPCPEGLHYYPFQVAGIEFLVDVKNAWLADEMGLGKTIQVIGLINTLELTRVLVVCPASLKRNWQIEFKRRLLPQHPVQIISGRAPTCFTCSFVVINYDILRHHLPTILALDWELIAGDESQAIKGRSQRSRAFLELKAQRKILLTGSPMFNRPEELWTSLKWLNPVEWNNYYYFAVRYCAAQRMRNRIVTGGASNTGELFKKLRSTLMIRRLKVGVLPNLPPKVRQVIELPCHNDELVRNELQAWEAYEKARAEVADLVKHERVHESDKTFRLRIMQLRETVRTRFNELARMRQAVAVYKLPALIAHLESAIDEHKVVCFAHHHQVIDAITSAFTEHVVLDGRTPPAKRQEIVNKFQENPSVRLFVGGLRAAGLGLTLTASSHVVFGEMDWTPAILSQAEDRCHRIRQKDSVLVQHLVLEGSLDARMARMCVEKQEMIDSILDRKEQS